MDTNSIATLAVAGDRNLAHVSVNCANTRHSPSCICEVAMVVGNEDRHGDRRHRDETFGPPAAVEVGEKSNLDGLTCQIVLVTLGVFVQMSENVP